MTSGLKIGKTLAAGAIGALLGLPAHAMASSQLSLADASMCTRYMARAESAQGIPKQLLSAIAMTESGRWSDQANAVVPWPWTINSQGKGYYFDSMHEAITFAKRLQQRGIDSMDVGCMQVNLHHHPNAFASLIDAFDPEKNVAYGAKFLRGNYDDLKSWPAAIGAYHSRTPGLSQNYYASVRSAWSKVLHGAQVVVADAALGIADEAAKAARFVGGVAIRGTAPRKPVKAGSANFQLSVRDKDGYRVLDRSRFMRKNERMPAEASVLKVGEQANSRAPEVLVVRPAAEKLAETAPAAGEENAVTLAMAPVEASSERFVMSKQIKIDSPGEGGASVKSAGFKRSGPRFIFD